MNKPVATKAQRAAIYRLFARHYSGLEQDLARPHGQLPRWPSLAERLFPNRAWRALYRQYRKRFGFSGIGSDLYLFGQPFVTGEGQLWVGIESDGYTHS